ncbi:MAG: hypothetical protein AABZ06_06835 [Bdellovibrionota bacterium]
MNQGYRFTMMVLLSFCLIASPSCKQPEEEAVAPTNTLTPVGTIDNNAGFYVIARDECNNSTWPDYKTRFSTHKDGDFAAPCTIKSDSTSKDITCIIETEELDLYSCGVKIQHNVPSDMCTYFLSTPYYYLAYAAGAGPLLFSYDIDINNSLTNIDVNDSGSNPQPNGGIDAGGNPYCNYDYTSSSGPNCCTGSYNLIIRKWDADKVDYGEASISKGTWNGSTANCLTGPAMDTQPKNSAGWPKSLIYAVENQGLNSTYDVAAPMNKERTPIYAANYYTGTKPAPVYNPYYEFSCLDRAFEIKARIRVQIREWNEVAEFEKGASGNPDTTGTESDFSGESKNDFPDWDDYGKSTYPGF